VTVEGVNLQGWVRLRTIGCPVPTCEWKSGGFTEPRQVRPHVASHLTSHTVSEVIDSLIAAKLVIDDYLTGRKTET
jgi:hypothetical protein